MISTVVSHVKLYEKVHNSVRDLPQGMLIHETTPWRRAFYRAYQSSARPTLQGGLTNLVTQRSYRRGLGKRAAHVTNKAEVFSQLSGICANGVQAQAVYRLDGSRVKFPKKRRILRPGEVISLAGFLLLPNCYSLGFSIRVNSHANFICAMQDICDVIH
ncbi:hypothetical protein SFRURICE_004358 [Spodoptera frugiperda]|nr:hypothetical protein SFRURICE_004358 [Spodoptera frugiperda]